MVSLNSILTLGVLGGAALLYFKYGGISGIGKALGGAVSGFGSGVTQGINRFGNLVEIPNPFQEEQKNEINIIQRIVEQENIQDYVTSVPSASGGMSNTLTPQQRGGLTYAGFLESNNLGGTINLRTNEFKNQYGIQPLDFTISGSGGINTGRIGLSDATLNAQAALSREFGIPTFDTQGNLSTFGGLVTGK
jgi:hypothetical protein|tara:strand:- start:201 stop:776 length:576 start_codon:yes stop_codon:yes gene_type:complete